MKKISILLLSLLAIACTKKEDVTKKTLDFAIPIEAAAIPEMITLELEVTNPADVRISIAPLKYNKDFAYSFTMDDALSSTYDVVYPLLKGGKVSDPFIDCFNNDQGADGSISPGYFYTDGCGNDINFQAAVAVNSIQRGEDMHNGSLSAYMTWDGIQELYNEGWDILNHSYSHDHHKEGIYNDEIVKNIKRVYERTGIELTQMAFPFGDTSYHQAGIKHNLVAMYDQHEKWQGPTIAVDGKMNLEHFILRRGDLRSDTSNLETYIDSANAMVRINKAYNQCENGKHIWYNDYTHTVSNDNVWNISVLFHSFKYYMQEVEREYGRFGKDNVWMAPLQQVYEYLAVRDNTTISSKVHGNTIEITIDLSQVPNYLRRYALSLNLTGAEYFILKEGTPIMGQTYNNQGESQLINLDIWNRPIATTETK